MLPSACAIVNLAGDGHRQQHADRDVRVAAPGEGVVVDDPVGKGGGCVLLFSSSFSSSSGDGDGDTDERQPRTDSELILHADGPSEPRFEFSL